MTDKKRKETELKQSLMQKDKEQLVELYLQMKWERDYLEGEKIAHKQIIENIKAENERLKTFNKSLNAIKDEAIKRLDTIRTSGKSELKKEVLNLQQQLKATTKQVCDKIRDYGLTDMKEDIKGVFISYKTLNEIEKGGSDNAKADNN